MPPNRYGVKEQTNSPDAVASAVEDLRLMGYSVLPSGLTKSDIDRLSDHFDRALERSAVERGGIEKLRSIDEHNTIRALLSVEPSFLDLARNPNVLSVCERLLGDYFILNQQNGVINPPGGARYNQDSYHRDLPYLHLVSSRPLAINALFCLDEFTAQNGATLVLPASHKEEAFPSDAAIERHAHQVTAPRGSFIVLDCMCYHSGGLNMTGTPRRAINHVYSLPYIRQQIDLPAILTDAYRADPVLAQFLGYGVTTPRSVAAYDETRRK